MMLRCPPSDVPTTMATPGNQSVDCNETSSDSSLTSLFWNNPINKRLLGGSVELSDCLWERSRVTTLSMPTWIWRLKSASWVTRVEQFFWGGYSELHLYTDWCSISPVFWRRQSSFNIVVPLSRLTPGHGSLPTSNKMLWAASPLIQDLILGNA